LEKAAWPLLPESDEPALLLAREPEPGMAEAGMVFRWKRDTLPPVVAVGLLSTGRLATARSRRRSSAGFLAAAGSTSPLAMARSS